MDNPFTPAEWGETYDLAGSKWKAGPGLYVLVVEACGKIDEASHYPCWMAAPPHKPLLPPPAWVNEQDNPREVAIAALERAGFEDGDTGCVRIELDEYGDTDIAINKGDCKTCTVYIFTCSDVRAQ